MTAFWPDGARLALSVVVNVEEGAEMRVSDGDKAPEPVDELGVTLKRPIRVHGNESNYLYGIKAGAPRIMKLLDDHQITATFTAAALALRALEFQLGCIPVPGGCGLGRLTSRRALP